MTDHIFGRGWESPPDVSLAALDGAVADLRRSAGALSQACRALQAHGSVPSASGAGVGTWSGQAAIAFDGRREVLAAALGEVADVAWLTAEALAEFARELAGVLAQWVLADRFAQAAALRDAVAGQDRLDVRELDRALALVESCRARYRELCFGLGRRLIQLREVVIDHAQDIQDVAAGFTTTLVDHGFREPLTALWAVSGEALVDRHRWWSTVAAIPRQGYERAREAIDDPGAEIEAWLDADQWRRGRIGEALADAALLFTPSPRWLEGSARAGARRFALNRAPAARALPPLQSLDEMLESGVDLSLHEHRRLGHAVRRHVAVGPDYLMDRLTHGTLRDDGSRGPQVRHASAFSSLHVAQEAVGVLLSRHAGAVRDFAANGAIGESLVLSGPLNEHVGLVMQQAPGGFLSVDADAAGVVLRIGERGMYISTAFCGTTWALPERVARGVGK